MRSGSARPLSATRRATVVRCRRAIPLRVSPGRTTTTGSAARAASVTLRAAPAMARARTPAAVARATVRPCIDPPGVRAVGVRPMLPGGVVDGQRYEGEGCVVPSYRCGAVRCRPVPGRSASCTPGCGGEARACSCYTPGRLRAIAADAPRGCRPVPSHTLVDSLDRGARRRPRRVDPPEMTTGGGTTGGIS